MVLPVITPYGATLGRVDQSGVEQVDVAFTSVPQRCLRALPQPARAITEAALRRFSLKPDPRSAPVVRRTRVHL